MIPRSLFISGVPATGKSWLGSWLAETQGYVHIDAEKDGGIDFDRANLHSEWDELVNTGRGKSFGLAAERLNKPIVLNWGFPMTFLKVVAVLKEAGMQPWWLQAESAQARVAFAKRENKKPQAERIPVECFDRQIAGIEQCRTEIERVFDKNVVSGLNLDGSQRRPEQIWADMNR